MDDLILAGEDHDLVIAEGIFAAEVIGGLRERGRDPLRQIAGRGHARGGRVPVRGLGIPAERADLGGRPVRERRAQHDPRAVAELHRLHRVYTGPGRGLAQILARTTSLGSPQTAQAWLTRHGMTAAGLPKDLPVEAWVDLFKTTGSSPPSRRTQSSSGRRRR